MYTLTFWKDAFERAISTGVQALLALIIAGPGFDVLAFGWGTAGVVVLSAVVLSLIKAVAAASLVKSDAVSPASLATNDHSGV